MLSVAELRAAVVAELADMLAGDREQAFEHAMKIAALLAELETAHERALAVLQLAENDR